MIVLDLQHNLLQVAVIPNNEGGGSGGGGPWRWLWILINMADKQYRKLPFNQQTTVVKNFLSTVPAVV